MDRSTGAGQEQSSAEAREALTEAARRWEAEAALWRALVWTWAAVLAFITAGAVEVLTDGGWPAVCAAAVALLVTVVAVRETVRARPA